MINVPISWGKIAKVGKIVGILQREPSKVK